VILSNIQSRIILHI